MTETALGAADAIFGLLAVTKCLEFKLQLAYSVATT